MQLENKIALITGAGSGIGRATALRFAREGAKVVVNDVTTDQARGTAEQIGGDAVPIGADVTDPAQIRKMFDEVENRFGRLDILVNNAGIGQTDPVKTERYNRIAEARLTEAMSGEGVRTPWNMTLEMEDEEWDVMIRTHLYGTFYCSRAALHLMTRQDEGGAIINLSSIAGLSGLEAIPHYCAAKAGILGFTRALALEVGSQKIRVNAICPGFIDTPMTQVFGDTMRQAIVGQTPLGRWAQPEEIAATAVFLASNESSFFTGQWLSPNGGLVMQ